MLTRMHYACTSSLRLAKQQKRCHVGGERGRILRIRTSSLWLIGLNSFRTRSAGSEYQICCIDQTISMQSLRGLGIKSDHNDSRLVAMMPRI